MKKIKILVTTLIIGGVAYAQQPPQGTPGGGINWKRGGNSGPIGSPNIFGTSAGNNNPIYTYTNGVPRMVVNGDKTPTIFSVPVNTSGFVGINTTEPKTYLTINGPNNTSFQNGAGFRNWMRTGVFKQENSDHMYVGMKSEGFNRSDATICFGDDGGTSTGNNLRFLFTGAGIPTDGFTELGRFSYNFNLGIGPAFTNIVPPNSLVHLNRDGNKETWLQITNQTGTGQTVTDGLRFGIRNGNNASAYLRWQEQTPFIIQTDWNANAGGINSGERMRISSINAPNVPNPTGLPNNTTRVSISHQGDNPITEPRSLLHLGYNTGSQLNPNSTDGWRDWMDVGTFTNIGTDNMYVGLKKEAGGTPADDKHDAVINWGDNGGNNPLNGPDHLRFIFTETQTSSVPGNAPATSNGGLEVARFTPERASTLPAPNFGMMGIGDFNNVAPPIDAKLDIDGDLRIRTVTQDDNLTQILAIDPIDENRVHWVDASNLSGGNVTADNGLSIDPNNPNNVQLGVACTLPSGEMNTSGILASQLTTDRVVANRNHNFWFGSLNNETGGVGIGGQPSSTTFCTTGNTLEISANNNGKYGNTNASGVRLTKLTSANPTIANGVNGVDNTKVLTVDSDGDIVLTDAVATPAGLATADNGLSIDPLNPANVQLGQEVIGGTLSFTGSAELLNDREIPLNGHDLIFSSTNNGFTTPGIERISIGLNPFAPGAPIFPTNPQNYVSSASAKLNLLNTTEETGAHFVTFMDPANVGFAPPQYSGIKGTVYGLHNDKSIIGVLGQGVSALTGVVVEGVRGEAYGSGVNIGVKGISFTANKTSYGGFFRSHSATGVPCLNGDNYGIYAEARGSSVSNIAVYATIEPSNPCNAADNWAGYFNGDVYISGAISGPSDANLKTNIVTIENGLDVINQLNPVNFDFDNSVKPRLNLQSGKQYGLIAQEVETILPELVGTSVLPAAYDSLGNQIDASYQFKTLDYEKFVPILIAGMQEQQGNIDSLVTLTNDQDSINSNLEIRLAALENCINEANLCSQQARVIDDANNGQTIELSNLNAIILDQNLPNPFAENTTITYSIPDDVMDAQLLFYDMNGRIIKQVNITDRGESKLTVYGDNLEKGIYTYSLIADGKLIATKKMVKQ